MYDYSKFEEQILSELQEKYPELEFKKFFVEKVDRSYNSISVSSKYKDTFQIGVQIDLDHWYTEFKNKGVSIDEILNLICAQLKYLERDTLILKQKIKNTMNFENIKNKIFARVVNKKKAEKVKDMAVYEIEDLACLFFIDLDENYIFHVTIGMINMWGIDIAVLKEIALKNIMKKYQLRISPINEVIYEMMGGEANLGMEIPLYVATLDNKGYPYHYSAVLIALAPELLNPTPDDKYYIIPSSEHELLLIREDVSSIDEIKDIIWHINRTVVNDNDFLSNNLYQYDNQNDKIKIVQ